MFCWGRIFVNCYWEVHAISNEPTPLFWFQIISHPLLHLQVYTKAVELRRCTIGWKYPRLDICCTAPDLLIETEQPEWVEVVSQATVIQERNGTFSCHCHICWGGIWVWEHISCYLKMCVTAEQLKWHPFAQTIQSRCWITTQYEMSKQDRIAHFGTQSKFEGSNIPTSRRSVRHVAWFRSEVHVCHVRRDMIAE